MRRSWMFWIGTTIAVANLATLASLLVRNNRARL
jgi:hypothetical protein